MKRRAFSRGGGISQPRGGRDVTEFSEQYVSHFHQMNESKSYAQERASLILVQF